MVILLPRESLMEVYHDNCVYKWVTWTCFDSPATTNLACVMGTLMILMPSHMEALVKEMHQGRV